MATTFKQMTATGGLYLWSTPANWTNGLPYDGATVTINVVGGGNPSSYDDIAGLYLESLTLQEGYLSISASLVVGSLTFGVFPDEIDSDTLLTDSTATLTIDGFSGSGYGIVGAFGAGAVTNVLAKTDPGEIYEVDEGGELVLAATPNASSGHSGAGFYYEDSTGGPPQLPSGTIAFNAPGATVASLLSGGGDRRLDRAARQRRLRRHVRRKLADHHHQSGRHHLQRRRLFGCDADRLHGEH